MNTDSLKPRLLVVDDVPANIKILSDVLQEHYQISYATNGKEALELAESTPPDMILLDVIMPGMDGYEVCTRLKSQENTRETPIIFVTALNDEHDESKGFAVGAVDYITKPIVPSIVLARVKTHISLRQAQLKLVQQNSELVKHEQLRTDVERMSRHDLRGPINLAVGFATVLRDEDSLNEAQKTYLQFILDGAYMALHMINLSQGMFQMEMGTYPFEPTKVDLVPIIQKVTSSFRDQIIYKSITLEIMLHGHPLESPHPLFVQGEEILCYSLFSNLVKNAIEASPKGKFVTISLGYEHEMVEVSVHNEGSVPVEMRERFFEKYATMGKKTGSGLGTYSAKLMTEIQKGNIYLNTSEGDATTIRVMLVRAVSSQDS